MIRRNFTQGEDDWLAWRDDKLTASECSVVSGSSPWGTPLQMYQRKKGELPPIEQNAAMAIGNAEEDNARKALEAATGISFAPACYETECGDYGASLDGESMDGLTLCELKVPMSRSSKLWGFVAQGKPPEYYMDQMRQQAWVRHTAKDMYFGVYDYGTGEIEYIHLDAQQLREEFERDLLPACQKFVECLKSGTPPEMTDKDYEHRTDAAYLDAATRYKDAKAQADSSTDELNAAKAELKALTDGTSSEGSGVKCSWFTTSRVDNKQLTAAAQDAGIDPEQFKKTTKQLRITISKEATA